MRILTVPGIDGSGSQHWQTIWEQQPELDCTRFCPSSWNAPQARDWLDAVLRGAQDRGPDVVIVAHSLGCLPVSHLAGQGLACQGVVLVAPPDVHGPAFPSAAAGFTGLAASPSRVPALVISSSDDPYCAPVVAAQLAARWRAEHVDVGAHGHLNESSQLGSWDEGMTLVKSFVERLAP